MFIKVKIANGNEIMLNSDTIIRISSFAKPHTKTGEPLNGCYVELVDGTVVEVHQPLNQLGFMLNANSIEKEIARLKTEFAMEIFAEIEAKYGKQSGADRGDDLTYGQVQDFFEELKKKYMEDEKDNG